MIKYCKRCTMPNTRPGLTIDDEGICSACRVYDKQATIDWDKRKEELTELFKKYKSDSEYDCIIAVSGGKDSHFQVNLVKNEMGMNPLLVTVEDNYPPTEAGAHNIKNISEVFNCNIISLKPNGGLQKRIDKYVFEKYGRPTWLVDRYIYTYPFWIAHYFKIPLIIYGENVSYTYSGVGKDVASAKDQINNGVSLSISDEEIRECGATDTDMKYLNMPEDYQDMEPIYLSYFFPWNSYKNYEVAQTLGFRDLLGEWDRANHIEAFDQIDSAAYLLAPFMKVVCLGHGPITDQSSRFIRYGKYDRKVAIRNIIHREAVIDTRIVREYCEYYNINQSDFYKILDKHFNKNIFEKTIHGWKLKKEVIDRLENA